MIDGSQLVGESLSVANATEILVIDTRGWKLAYRGPIDDRIGNEAGHSEATRNYLTDALNSMIDGQPLQARRVTAKDCPIDMPELSRRTAHVNISYSKTIAPCWSRNARPAIAKAALALGQ